MPAALLQRTVNAYNTAHASENKIHDDATAKRFGFTGGLVPGVDVYAYMTHPALATWGIDWLSRGRLKAGFAKPVYDGEDVLVVASGTDPMRVEVRRGDLVCASGEAGLEPAGGVSGADIASAPLPDERPVASPESLPKGKLMGTLELIYEADEGRQYLHDVREDHAFFEDGGIAHPGWLLRRANRILAENVRLGPWIHVGSDARFLGPLRAGQGLSVRGTVHDSYERKGHKIVELDVLALAETGAPVMRVHHTAIYAPRQVSEAGG